MAAHAPQRAELTQALAELDAALDETRAARVRAMAGEHLAHAHLVAVLGEPPADPAGQAVWRGLACRVESYRDRHPEALGHESDGGVMAAIGPRPVERWMTAPEWDALAGRLARGHALVAVAGEIASPGEDTLPSDPSSWIELMDQASLVLEASRQTVNRGLSRDHGLDLGLERRRSVWAPVALAGRPPEHTGPSQAPQQSESGVALVGAAVGGCDAIGVTVAGDN